MSEDQLFSAIRDGDDAAVHAAVGSRPDLLAAEHDGISVVRAACYAGHPVLAQWLRDAGAPASSFDLAALGEVEELRSLLDDAPDLVNAFAGDGFTALHLAAWFGHTKTAEALLAKGADPEAEATNGTGLRPLHSAAAGGHTVIAHLLLDRGADVDATQEGGVTALHSAAHRNDAEMVALLLGRGAHPAAATSDGRTARDLATDPDLLALLP